MAEGELDDRSLQEIPTWAVALVCAVFVVISISIEHGILSLGKLFHKRQKKAMTEALEKIKAELMILGFISLLLSVSTTYVVKICIPIKLGKTLLPCQHYNEKGGLYESKGENEGGDRRKLLSYAETMIWHRSLAARDEHEDYCSAKCNPHGSRTSQDDEVEGLGIRDFIFGVSSHHWQFLGSISKADYMAIRSGFINILVMVGTKLELVIMDMAQQIHDQAIIVRGSPMVQPSDDFFWFHRPQWILFLIHLTLFQNAFQMAFFLFTLFEFRHKPCFHEKLVSVLLRVMLGVALHVLCSYITFPLYALVTQMGSHMKQSIFQEQTAKALRNWHKSAKANQKKLRKTAVTPAFVAPTVCDESTPNESIPQTPVSSCQSEHSDDQHWDLEASNPISQQPETTEESHDIGFTQDMIVIDHHSAFT
ncbi:hypothetical protein AgCh_010433 [Apium graveolens]